MRMQKVEFWHKGKSLVLEIAGMSKPTIKILFSKAPNKPGKPRNFTVHKKVPLDVIYSEAKQLAEELCGSAKDEDAKDWGRAVRDIFNAMCQIATWT